jgi:hypothetical protein
VAEEYAMQHASAVGLRLLIRVEELERRVSFYWRLFVVLGILMMFPLARLSSSGRFRVAPDSRHSPRCC